MASYVWDAPEPLLDACVRFVAVVDWAGGDASAGLTHAEVEDAITDRVRTVASSKALFYVYMRQLISRS